MNIARRARSPYLTGNGTIWDWWRGVNTLHIALVTGATEAEVKDALEVVRNRLGATNLLNAVSIALLRGLIEQDI